MVSDLEAKESVTERALARELENERVLRKARERVRGRECVCVRERVRGRESVCV